MTIIGDTKCPQAWKPQTEDLRDRCAIIQGALTDVDHVYVENDSMVCEQGLKSMLRDGSLSVEPLTAVDVEFGECERRSPDSSTLLVVSAGRCSIEKGHHIVIDAFKRLSAEEPRLATSARLLVVASARPGGEYPHQRCYREALISKSQMEQKADIQIVEGMCKSDLASLLGRTDIVIIASLYEPFGLLALEAFASGADLVISKNVGCLNVLEGFDGVYPFNPLDVREFREALLAALFFSRRPCRSNGRERRDVLQAWSAIELTAKLERRFHRHIDAI